MSQAVPPTLDTPAAAEELLRSFVEERHAAESWQRLEHDPQLPLLPPERGGWLLQHEGGYGLLRVPAVEPTILSVRAGMAIEIPRSEDLALHLAAINKEVMAGRVFLPYGGDIALAVFEETVWGRSLSWEFEPGLTDFVTRFEYVLHEAVEVGAMIRSRFGGRPFAEKDWFHLVF